MTLPSLPTTPPALGAALDHGHVLTGNARSLQSETALLAAALLSNKAASVRPFTEALSVNVMNVAEIWDAPVESKVSLVWSRREHPELHGKETASVRPLTLPEAQMVLPRGP